MEPKIIDFSEEQSLDFRLVLILAILHRTTVNMINLNKRLRSGSLYKDGVGEHEVSLLNLIIKITSGTIIKINENGNEVFFDPGDIIGSPNGERVIHDCAINVSVTYYLETLACIAPFGKLPLIIILRGNCHCNDYQSIDCFRCVTIPLLSKVLCVNLDNENLSYIDSTRIIQSELEVKVIKRGVKGHISFSCPCIKRVNVIGSANINTNIKDTGISTIAVNDDSTQFNNHLDPGRIVKIRGEAWSSMISTQYSNMMIDSMRDVLRPYIPDVWIFQNNVKKSEEEKASIGLSIYAQTEKGYLYAADSMVCIEDDEKSIETLVRDVGTSAAVFMLQEISLFGMCDTYHQWMVLLFMSLSEDYGVSRFPIGAYITEYTLVTLRLINRFSGVRFTFKRQIIDEIWDPCDTEDTEEDLLENSDSAKNSYSEPRVLKNHFILCQCVGCNLINR